MPLARCPRTGNLFNTDDGPVHPDGLKEEEADYEQVREYLHQHVNASPMEVAKNTGVPYDCIERMIKQGMLQALTVEELDEQQRKLVEQGVLERLNQNFAEQIASLRLPEKKEVEFGGSVRSVFNRKRRVE